MKEATESSFASLSPSLLARKGGARPAMRPQLAPLPDMHQPSPAAANLDDLGWNDMGDDESSSADTLQLTPAPANPETEAEAEAMDKAEQAKLQDHAAEKRDVVRQQQETLKERLASAAAKPVEAVKPPRKAIRSPAKRRANGAAINDGKRAAFTLRLDAERHLKLRLASTIHNRSAQQIVTEALDKLLDTTPELESLAAQVKRR